MVSTWTFEDFKGAVADDIGSPPISDINLKVLHFLFTSWFSQKGLVSCKLKVYGQ
jgi:hypothetical protein